MVKVAGEGVPLLYLTIVLLVFSWVTYAVRVGVRRWIKEFGADDWFMGGGLVSLHQWSSILVPLDQHC